MVLQPSNSPDLHTNKLGVFWSLQKKTDILNVNCKNEKDLQNALFKVFHEVDRDTLVRFFGYLIGNYLELLNHCGDDFITLHFGPIKRQKDGIDVYTLPVDQELFTNY
jgi:hypothetical protein